MGLVGNRPGTSIFRKLAGELFDDYWCQSKLVVNIQERVILVLHQQCVQLVSVAIATFWSIEMRKDFRLTAWITGQHGGVLQAMVEHRHPGPA